MCVSLCVVCIIIIVECPYTHLISTLCRVSCQKKREKSVSCSRTNSKHCPLVHLPSSLTSIPFLPSSRSSSLLTSFLPPPSFLPSSPLLFLFLLQVETKAQAAMGDKVRHRLEQLDDLEEGSVQETLNLSQRDYVKKIDDLNRSLVTAWDNDQRVRALKIAIQVCTVPVFSSLHCASILLTALCQYSPHCTVPVFSSLHCASILLTASTTAVLQATGRHFCDPVLPKQVCAHHGHSGQLW